MPLDESRLPPGWTIKPKTIKGRVWYVAVNDGIKLKPVTKRQTAINRAWDQWAQDASTSRKRMMSLWQMEAEYLHIKEELRARFAFVEGESDDIAFKVSRLLQALKSAEQDLAEGNCRDCEERKDEAINSILEMPL